MPLRDAGFDRRQDLLGDRFRRETDFLVEQIRLAVSDEAIRQTDPQDPGSFARIREVVFEMFDYC